jgi:alpha-L-fucosidase 2
MTSSRRGFLAASVATTVSAQLSRVDTDPLDGFEIARRHKILRDSPTPNFFEGMLLGNGDIGLCITVRPDALGLHLGKSDSWDIRVNEEHTSHVLPFSALLKLWEQASEEAKRQGHPEMTYLENKIPAFRAYTELVGKSYREIWPRPWPCGILWVHWDATRFQVRRQSLDPSHGLFELELLASTKPVIVRALVNTQSGHVVVWSDSAADFSSIAYHPHTDPKAQLPEPEVEGSAGQQQTEFSAFQRFPATAPTVAEPHPGPTAQDRSFALHAVVGGKWQNAEGNVPGIEFRASAPQPLRIDIGLATPRPCGQPDAGQERSAAVFSSDARRDYAFLAPLLG